MPQADEQHNTNRNDAELLSLCEQFIALDAHHGAELADNEDWDAVSEPILAVQEQLAARIKRTRACSLVGAQAVARALFTWAPDIRDDIYALGRDGAVADALLRALLASLSGTGSESSLAG